ncbi:MAG: hypothetical protein JWP12_1418 [Bacteroidetes bacterium]|nr:hypothetical protein [Bacteroidota bacterium]
MQQSTTQTNQKKSMKKIITLFLLLLLAATGTVFSQAGPEILHYRFDSTGTTVRNLASAPPAGASTANIMGGITQGAAGQCGGALIGSGNSSSTDYLNTGFTTNLSGPWTISVWTSNITASATLFYIFGDLNAGSFRCFTNGVAGANNWILRGPFTDVYVNGGATVAPHITTFVYDDVAGNIYGYLDGVLVATVPQTPITITGPGPFKVMGYSANVGSPAGGLLDEFRMYSRALTAAEVADLHFTTHTSASLTACDTYTDNRGRMFNVAGTYVDTVTSSLGCDSLVDLTLTLHNSSAGSVTTTECDSYTAADGAVYTTSGTYSAVVPNAVGCDSTISINLTVINSSGSTISPVTCNSYTAVDGTTYTTSGAYSAIVANAAGCDSIITINLTINTPSSSTISATGCGGSYTAPDGAVYISSGTETAIIPNYTGCDSTITINLTIISVDTSVTVNLPVITANEAGATYQWIDCGTSLPIAGETNQSFTAAANGDYAVVVTMGTCSGTSICVSVMNTGVAQAAADNIVNIYPNPTNGSFSIQTGAVANLLVVTDLLGRTVTQIKPVTTRTVIDLTGEKNGVYFVKIITEKGTKTMKIVKQ